MPAGVASAFLGAAVLGGCGSATVAELPPAAGPARSPPPAVAPAGRVVRLGPRSAAPDRLAFDVASGRVVVGERRPAALALVDARTGRVAKRVGLPAAPGQLATQDGDVLVPAGRLLRVRARDGRVLRDTRLVSPARAAVAAGFARALVVGGGGPLSPRRASTQADSSAAEPRGTLSAVVAGRRRRERRVAAEPGDLARAGSGRVAVVSGRERVVELFDATTLDRVGRAAAGVGPARAVARDRWLWVTDTQGDALLVFRTSPKLELVRRVYLPGGPYAIALDRGYLWVTLTRTNEVAELPAHGRPHVLQRLPTVRQPDAVTVDPATRRLFVAGRADGVLELIDPSRLPELRTPAGRAARR